MQADGAESYKIASVSDEQLARIRKAEEDMKEHGRELILIAYEKDRKN